MARDGLARLAGPPLEPDAPTARDDAAAVGLLESTSTCAISCCATATGPAWSTRSSCGRPSSTPRCWRPGAIHVRVRRGAGKAMIARSPREAACLSPWSTVPRPVSAYRWSPGCRRRRIGATGAICRCSPAPARRGRDVGPGWSLTGCLDASDPRRSGHQRRSKRAVLFGRQACASR